MVVGPPGRVVVQVAGYWTDGPNGVLGMWYIEGSQLLGLGSINYNMRLQGPCNCYWLLTGLERCTLRAADIANAGCQCISECRLHLRSCILKVIVIYVLYDSVGIIL